MPMPAAKENKHNIKMTRHSRLAWLSKLGLCLALTLCLIDNAYVFAQGDKHGLADHIRLAEHYHDLGQYNQAKLELEAALKLDPKNPEILNSLGAIYLNLSESSPESEKRISNLVAARKYFTSALNLDSDFAAAWNGMAGVYYLSAENTKAISCYKKALALAPKRAYEVYTNLANTLRDSGQMVDAEENYQKAIELNPLYAPAHNGYAELLYNKQRFSEALPEAVEAIRLKPDYATAYYHLGLIQCAGGNKTDALKAYLLSLRYEKNPRYGQDTRLLISQLGLDISLVSAHDLEQFQNNLCRPTPAPSAVQKNKKQAEAAAELSATEANLSKASVPELPEGPLRSELNTIHILMTNKEWERAAAELSVLLKKHPDDAVVLNELGLVYFNQKKYSAAEKLFKRAIVSSRQQSSTIYYNLGQVYLCNHNLIKAQECLEKAKGLAKNEPGNRALINNTLGIALKQKGDLSGAQTAYEEAIADGGKQYPVFHYNLGMLLEKMNKQKEAAKEFNLYLQLDPNGLNAKNAKNHLSKML